MRTDFDALIVGAGLAGSSAAILLARAGWSVALVEKENFPRRKVCGECVAASNFPLLDALGVGDEFARIAGPELQHVAVLSGHSQTVARLPPADHPKHLWGRALGRERLDPLLLAQARLLGAHVLQPWSVQAVQGRPGAWQCDVRAIHSTHTKTLNARVVIDAHGSWQSWQSWQSLAATRTQQPRERRGADLFAFKANFTGAALASGVLPILSFNGGYGGMVLADDGVTTVACCIRRDVLLAARTALPGVAAGEVVERLLQREISGVRSVLHGATRHGSWLSAGPINPGVRVAVNDQIFRIGNAAGEAHPIIGEGMSMALQSAWLLCAQLLDGERMGVSQGPRDNDWQRTASRAYAVEWRRQFAPRLRLAAAIAAVAARPYLSIPSLAIIRAFPQLLTAGARWSGKNRCAVDRHLIAAFGPELTAQPFQPLRAKVQQ